MKIMMTTFSRNLFILCACALFLNSCAIWNTIVDPTRRETDVYRITTEDSTVVNKVQNQPGNRSNGVVYPSSRVIETKRNLIQADSVVVREYPNFIRMGLFESVGLIGSNSAGQGLGVGMFGLFYDPADYFSNEIQGKSSALFGGGLYRFGMYEARLNWFKGAKNWTIGTNFFEMFLPEADNSKTFASVFPIYVRKRFYLREDIPYLCVTPSLGLGYLPSQYIHGSVSLDFGSIGGLNVRAYAGGVFGGNASGNRFNSTAESSTSFFPYFGIGASVLDFLNKESELGTEWKDMPHSGWDIGVASLGFFSTPADSGVDFISSMGVNGLQLRLANASLAIPYLNNRFYAGTSLFNILAYGSGQWGMAVFPIRAGYWHTLLEDELSLEPFMEIGYYPSTFIHGGVRVNLALHQIADVSLQAGYMNGNSVGGMNNFLTDALGDKGLPFGGVYIGLTFGIFDRIFMHQELRYNKP